MNESQKIDPEKHVTPRVICAYGTRPEKIKLAPVVEALRARGVEVTEWVSGQSKDLVTDFAEGRKANWENLFDGISGTIRAFAFDQLWLMPPDAVIVQGDTATAFACAQAAFLARVPVAHVEAGLRTYAEEPWPEEAFRRQIVAVARWHFCPDEIAAENVLQELGNPFAAVTNRQPSAFGNLGVHIVGNTVIDALNDSTPFRVLATLHRRENWGARRQQALKMLAEFERDHDRIQMKIVKHPNGTADYGTVASSTATRLLVEPMDHASFLDELINSDLVVTDSGGLQEEAAHFGIPCLVLRTATERVALERTGAVVLVHPDDPEALRANLEGFLAKRRCYGDGTAGERIAEILVRELATTVDSNPREA